jgi:transglutaminase-like putative cysteine protease
MDDLDWSSVGRRIGQLAGALAFVIMMGRLGRLLETGPQYPSWNLILAASTFLGGVAWWLLGQVTSNRKAKVAVFAAAGVLLALRVSVPQTLTAGILPSEATPAALGETLELALRTIRSGIAPVEPFVGILSILAIAMWVIGALFTWGNTGGHHAAMFLPSLVMYFQFAVFDRIPAGRGWLAVSTLALTLSVVSIALERHEETGRARDAEGRPLHRRSVSLAAIMAALLGVASLAAADNASGLISEYGNAPWRTGDGLGPGPGGGVRFDGLVDLQQRILNPSNEPVFTARFAADTPPEINPYWIVDTLDTFDGEGWSRANAGNRRYEPGQAVVDEPNVYGGTTHQVLQAVRIEGLDTVLAPTAGTPIEIQDPTADSGAANTRRATEFHTVGGISIGVTGGFQTDDQYQLRTVVTDRTADLGALATDETGGLSPVFAAAAGAGVFPYQPSSVDDPPAVLPDRDRYLTIPEDTPPAIGILARSVTAGRTTDFEAAWMLQSWFRDGGGDFTYSTEVSTGHDALVLEDWLTDDTSVNYRTGYCEQFAAAMGVLARSLRIPSRVVWGFTPGSVDETGLITVRDTNAHAWVELWIEPYGWYPFDPTPRAEQTGFELQPPSVTAGLDPTDFLGAPEENPAQSPTNPEGQLPEFIDDPPPELDATANRAARWWLIGLVALVPLLLVIPLLKRLRRRRRLTRVRHGDITGAWDEIVDRLTDLGVPLPESLTPMELARATDRALMPLAMSYSSTVYGGRTGQARESDLIGVEWWIDRSYDGPDRARAAMSLKSLIRRP